jgi:porphobilinogen synthase
MRRLRKNEPMRSLLRETALRVEDLVYPLFVIEGKTIREPVASLPGIHRLSPDMILPEIDEVVSLGIQAVLLFGIPAAKDPLGTGGYRADGVVQQAIQAIKRHCPGLVVITDVCLCEYTSHGHCGVVRDKEVLNDPTLELLAKIAVSHARAGADVVAPSDMMDGRIKAIRSGLDEAGFETTPIMSYAAKFSSAFYGPFREAAQSAPAFGDRRSYQMDPANRREALREVLLDIEEGADIVMVKPALAYLDILREVRDRCLHPLAAYNVSGEYAMVKAAAQQGWIDGRQVMMEILLAIKRAGADLIITYFAKEAAHLLRQG